MRTGLALAAFLALALAWQHAVADPAPLAVLAADGHTTSLSRADIAALPTVGMTVSFAGEHGRVTADFSGPLLWSVLNKAGAIPAAIRSRVRAVVTTTGGDGYDAVLAMGEIDPAFEGKQVLLATMEAGKPIEGRGLRLVVPADKRGGRSVRDVVRIAVSQ
jgi:hypothetical protein